jgi:hypothetical protein
MRNKKSKAFKRAYIKPILRRYTRLQNQKRKIFVTVTARTVCTCGYQEIGVD